MADLRCWEGLVEGRDSFQGHPFRYWQAVVLELDMSAKEVSGWLSRNEVHKEMADYGAVAPEGMEAVLQTYGACIESLSGTCVEGVLQLETTDVVTTKASKTTWARRRYRVALAGHMRVTRGTTLPLEVLEARAAPEAPEPESKTRPHGQAGGELGCAACFDFLSCFCSPAPKSLLLKPAQAEPTPEHEALPDPDVENLALAERPDAVAALDCRSSWQGVMLMGGSYHGHAWRSWVFVCLFWEGDAGPAGETEGDIYQVDCFKEIDGSPEPRPGGDPYMARFIQELGSCLERASGTFKDGMLTLQGKKVEAFIGKDFLSFHKKWSTYRVSDDMSTMTWQRDPRTLSGVHGDGHLFASPMLVLTLVAEEDLSSVSCLLLSGEEKLAVATHSGALMREVKSSIQIHGVPQSRINIVLPSGELLGEEHLGQTVAEVFG